MDALKNFAYSLVATAPSPATSGTTLVVASGQGALFPTAPFDVTIWPSGVQPLSTNAEICRVTNVSTDTFTITRAQYGTTAQSITAGFQIAQTIDANLLNQLAALSGATFTGAVSGTTFTGSGEISGTDLKATGLTGATAGARFIGGTSSGSPSGGTYQAGDFAIDQTGKIWYYTSGGAWFSSSQATSYRSASATVGINEKTIFAGSTTGQTLTLPATSVNGVSNYLANYSSVNVTVSGGTNSLNVYGTTGNYTLPPGGELSVTLSGGVWYAFTSNNQANQVGITPISGGGTNSTYGNLVKTTQNVTVSSNAASVSASYGSTLITNNAAGAVTITMSTSGAVDGQTSVVRFLDFSAVAQTLTWVNTENSSVTAPATSNGSTTSPLSVGFIYNGATSKWRCMATA
jgi:hypothetical protein